MILFIFQVCNDSTRFCVIMPLFRRKTDSSLPRASSISVYGQGRAHVLFSSKNAEKSDSSSFSSVDMDDRPQPFLAFAEATFDPSLPIKTKSRLSKDLKEVLHDNAALAYFIQFMDANKAKHLVKFWLEAESFRISSETRRKSQVQKSHTHVPSSSSSSGCISEKSDDVFHLSSHANNSGFKDIDENDVSSVDSASQKPFLVVNSKTTRQLSDRTIEVQNTTPVNSSDAVVACKSVSNDVLDSEVTLDLEKQSTQNSDPENSTCKDWDPTKQTVDSLKDGLIKLETSIEQDADSIYSKYVAQDAPFPIGIDDELRNAVKENIFKSSGHFDPNCFVPAQEYVVTKMDKEYFSTFLRSSFHCKHQIDVLTSGNVFLADVLYNYYALHFFMEFMEQEAVRHLVDFLLMADNFQKNLLAQENYDGVQAQADAMVLYEKYFSLQATSSLGFSDQIRYEVEANICREGGPLPDCFIKPVKILTQYLEKTYLLQFLASQLYFKYISECIILIQNEGNDVVSQEKYTASDSGSEQSLPTSSVNTLLAMDSRQPGASKILKNIEDQDMRIDTVQFKPDALWQRPLAGKLQMAHVDHLGRVTTEFEPQPDKKRESRISKAMKKLVNWEEDKNQEDMAWKVAEMIVKDICSVTMPEPGESSEAQNPS